MRRLLAVIVGVMFVMGTAYAQERVGAGRVEVGAFPGGGIFFGQTTDKTGPNFGDYALGAAHEAVVAWCRSHDLRLAGPSWEVYGHMSADAPPRTDIFYLLDGEAP